MKHFEKHFEEWAATMAKAAYRMAIKSVAEERWGHLNVKGFDVLARPLPLTLVAGAAFLADAAGGPPALRKT